MWMQKLADTHDTLSSGLPVLGVDCIDHVVPFHVSANEPKPLDERVDPTAMHELLDRHETPPRVAEVDWLGVGTTDQLAPLHICANVLEEDPDPNSPPVAMQVVTDGQDTPVSSPVLSPEAIVIVRARVAAWAGLPLSVTRTVKDAVPAGPAGVPVIVPPGLSVSPAGSLPELSDQV
jgi:hypothetical protein